MNYRELVAAAFYANEQGIDPDLFSIEIAKSLWMMERSNHDQKHREINRWWNANHRQKPTDWAEAVKNVFYAHGTV